MREAKLSADLPEHLALLYDHRAERFETPLDPSGIADIDAIFELAIRTYPETLPSFTSGERNKHHVYWTESWWNDYARSHGSEDRQTIHLFRNSTPQIAYVPKPIHAWIETVMIPPPPPPIEVMRHRNEAWTVASILLKSVVELDRARTDYDEKKLRTRRVLGYIAGVTPKCRQIDVPYIDVVDTEYWLSELNTRLDGWKGLADIQDELPTEHRLLPMARLSEVRALKRRIHHDGAIIPRIPDFASAA